MSRWERTGERDLAYSAWHRTLDDELTYIDLDAVEYCAKCREPLLLMELARDHGQPKATTVLRALARRADLPAILVFYSAGSEGIRGFRVRVVAPAYSPVDELLTPDEFAQRLRDKRARHSCAAQRVAA